MSQLLARWSYGHSAWELYHTSLWYSTGVSLWTREIIMWTWNRKESMNGDYLQELQEFSGAFAKLRNATVMSIMFTCPSAWNNSAPIGRILMKFVFEEFKVCKSVHHHTIQINQPTRCNNFSTLLLDVYVQLNMFRPSSRPSSGAQQLQ